MKKVVKKKPAVSRKPEASATATPLIVGIGASAGGLEAFTLLLRALAVNTGMAFVLVQHLEPKHESVLTRLLAKATEMPVEEARDGRRVAPDHVYVIPANADLRLEDGCLRVIPRQAKAGHHLPIDHFFRSLAEAQGSRAIGVILSGTASDGTAGLSAIKVEGGVTFAQLPESAKFDGMPRSAIAAGCVDLVLSPERIAKELARMAQHPFLRITPLEGIPAIPAQDHEWPQLFRLLRQASQVDFSRYKQSTIKRRLARRMALQKVDDLKAYLKLLENNPAEVDALFQEILIHVTEFFRDPEVFDALRKKILPQLLAEKPAGEPLRVWVAGCSTGEEAYSIAICALEYLGKRAATTPIQIFATDISDAAIQKARAGKYPAEDLRNIPKDRIQNFFTPVNGHYQVNSNIREMCVFARHDLTKDPPFSKLDLVSCRNVLIYFEAPLQKKVLESLHYALKPTGLLLLGKTESLSAHTDLFTSADQKHKFFFKNTAVAVPFPLPPAGPTLKAQGTPQPLLLPGFDLEKEADRMVWERYAHAGLVVNSGLHILHFRGDTSPYLRPAPGRATFELLKMVRDDLSLELRAAIQEARKTGHSIRREGLRLKQDGKVRKVNLEVRPMPAVGDREKCFLLLFEDTGLRAEKAGKPVKAAARSSREHLREQELRTAHAELASAREYVQAVIRDQDATNEELKTANEEALSSMEELQSTNEELETAKEELQSTNEELITLNEQLQNRNAELARTTDDLTNVLSGVNIPILILNQDRRIRRFTPPAETLLRLLPGDIGRPIGDLRIGISIPDMEKLIASVIETGTEVRREVQGEQDGRWYMLSMLPFRTGENKIEGVLMAFVDIHELKQQHDALREDRDFIATILDAAKGLLVLVLDPKGRIVHFNRECQELTGYSLEEVKGRALWDLLVPEEVAGAKAVFAKVLDGKPSRSESRWVSKSGHLVRISWSNTPSLSGGAVQYVIRTGIDVTAQREAEERAREGESTVQALLETALQGIVAVDTQGQIVLANPAAEQMFGYGKGELLGLPVGKLVPTGITREHAQDMAKWFQNPVSRPMGAGATLHGRRKDGSWFPTEVSLSAVNTRNAKLGVAFICDITDRKKNEAALEAYRNQLQQLTANLLASQEGGNREVARELHDVFSQELAAAGMEVAALLSSKALASEKAAHRLAALGEKLARLAEDSHSASRRLHPAILEDLGLQSALREECRNFQQHTQIPTDFDVQAMPASISRDVALCLYRVAQECLRNIAKHSGSKEVHVSLAGDPEQITLSVADWGNGFDLDQAMKKGGLGLISMEERVRLVHGTLTVHSEIGIGTTVTAVVPLKTEAA